MPSFKSLCLKISDLYKQFRSDINIKSLPMLVHNLATKPPEEPKDFTEERKYIAELIIKVLTSQLCVREALLKFPEDSDDTSLKIAWHALIHYEADEDLSKKDTTYKSVQVDFLEMIYNELKEGQELPQNLIMDYNIYYDDVAISKKDGFIGVWEKLTRHINT